MQRFQKNVNLLHFAAKLENKPVAFLSTLDEQRKHFFVHLNKQLFVYDNSRNVDQETFDLREWSQGGDSI
jgi:hypothetical protein